MPTGGFIDITIAYEGANGPEQITRRLATWGARVSDLSEPLTQIGQDLLADNAVNMVSEGSLFARGGWPQLAPSTVRDRERRGYMGAHPIEYRSGALAASLSSQGAEGNVFEVSETRLRVGTQLPYAGYQQSGTRKRSGGMPRRQIVGINRNRRAGIIARMNAFVRAAAAAEGILVTGGRGIGE